MKKNRRAAIIAATITLTFLAIIIALTFLVILGVRSNHSDEKETEPTTTDVAFEFDSVELYGDRDTSCTRIYWETKELNYDQKANLRSTPTTIEDNVIGGLTSRAHGYAKKVFVVYGSDGKTIEWYGMPQNTFCPGSEEIVWINSYYFSVSFDNYEPGDKDSGDYYTRMVWDEGDYYFYTTDGECNVRSSPYRGSTNSYGTLREGSCIDVRNGKIFADKYNLYYGVPASSIPDDRLLNKVGHLEEDPDGIVWISIEYCDTVYAR